MSEAARAMSQARALDVRLESASDDRLARALLLLAREHWVLVDRVRLLEAELARRSTPLDLDRARADDATAAALEAERDRFVSALLDELSAG